MLDSTTTIAGRIYQERALEAVWQAFQGGHGSALVVLPTGAGKTVLGAMLALRAHREAGLRTLFVAHRDNLVRQAEAKFRDFGLDVSTEMGGRDARGRDQLFGRTQAVVGSLQSMQGDRLYRWEPDEFGLIIIDECHHALSTSYANLLGHFRDYRLLGVTATPDRGDQKNLGAVFGHLAYSYPLGTAIHGDDGPDPGGWLVEPRVRRLTIDVDLTGIKFAGGDCNAGDLAERLGPRIEVMADAIRKEHGGRQTVVFLPDVGSCQALADVLNQREALEPIGASAEWVAGDGGKYGMHPSIRKDRMDRFERGACRLLLSCELLFEGWDHPPVKCVVNARATTMRYRFAQQVGRGLRPCPESGFDDCLVLDLDWRTDPKARQLACVIDLFDDGSMPESVIRVARAVADASPEREDPVEMVAEAQEYVRIRTKLQIKLTGKEAVYRTINLTDPLGIGKTLDLGLKVKYDLDNPYRPNPATDAQIWAIRQQGIVASKLSKWGASKLLGGLEARREKGLAHPSDVRDLLAAGVKPEIARGLSAAAAATSLAEIRTLESTPPSVQKELFR